MREYIAPFSVGVGFPKYVPYIDKFNQIIQKLTEAGLTNKWMKDVILEGKKKRSLEKLKGKSNADDDDVSITLSNLNFYCKYTK